MSSIFNSEQNKLIIFMIFTGIFFVVELVVGETSNCTALVADSFHMLSDVVSQVIALVAMTLTPKKWSKNTYGFSRAGDFGALTNAIFLGALCLSIFIESIKKFFDPNEIEDPRLVFIVGCIGLAINLLGMYFFHGHAGHGHSHGGHSHSDPESGHGHSHSDHSHADCSKKDIELQNMSLSKDHQDPEQGTALMQQPKTSKKKRNGHQLNVRGVYLHIMGDFFGSIVVIISSAISWFTDWEFKNYADPVISLVFVILIMTSVLKLLKASSMIMLLSVPKGFHLDEVTDTIYEKFPDILNIHELHFWSLSGEKSVLSMHIKIKEEIISSKQMVLIQSIKEHLHEIGVHSSVIQVEVAKKGSELESTCLLNCPTMPNEENCNMLQCCHYEEKGTSDGEKDPNSNLSVKTSGDEMNPEIDHSISQS